MWDLPRSPIPSERAVRAEVLNELGRVERLLGDLDAAIEHLKSARKFLDASDLVERALNAREMGLCLVSRDPKAAEKELRKAAQTYMSAGASSEGAKTLLELGRLMRSQGNVKEAANVMEQGLEIAASNN